MGESVGFERFLKLVIACLLLVVVGVFIRLEEKKESANKLLILDYYESEDVLVKDIKKREGGDGYLVEMGNGDSAVVEVNNNLLTERISHKGNNMETENVVKMRGE